MIHRAKVDRWLAALLGGVAGLLTVIGVGILAAGLVTERADRLAILLTSLVLMAAGLFVGLMLRSCYSTQYEVSPGALTAQFGPFRQWVPLDGVSAVFPTHNPLSALAPSLDRLRINYRGKNGRRRFVLVSPRDKDEFVQDLARAAPQLRPTDGPLRLEERPPC